jgi:hypothetical protein
VNKQETSEKLASIIQRLDVISLLFEESPRGKQRLTRGSDLSPQHLRSIGHELVALAGELTALGVAIVQGS